MRVDLSKMIINVMNCLYVELNPVYKANYPIFGGSYVAVMQFNWFGNPIQFNIETMQIISYIIMKCDKNDHDKSRCS